MARLVRHVGAQEVQHDCEMCETGQRRDPLKDRMEQQAQKGSAD